MKRVVFNSFVVIFSVLYILIISGLMGLLGDNGLGAEGNSHLVHHLGSSLVLVLVVTGLLSQLYKSGKKVAGFQQVIATMIGVTIMALIVGDPDNYGGNKGIYDVAFLIFLIPPAILLLLHPNTGEVYKLRYSRSNKIVLSVVLALAVPFFVYGINQSLLQRNSFPPLADIHHQHWLAMGTIAFSTILVGLIGAFRTRGFLLPLTLSATSFLLLGLVSMLNPNTPSSLGVGLGALSLAGGLVLAWQSVLEYKIISKNKTHDSGKTR